MGARVPLVANGEQVDATYIARYWPGGELNDRKDLKGWARCYGVLTGLTRLLDKSKETTERAAKRAAVLDAIAEVPEVVELVQRDADGQPRTLTVYQKSDVALRTAQGISVYLASLVDDYHVITQYGTQDDVELVQRCLDEQSYQQRLLAWIATSEGPRLPFPEGERRPTLPDHLATLHPLDFYSLAQAFQRVNVAGFAALEHATKPGSRPDWSVFWSGLEMELKEAAPKLMRDRGLLSLIAMASELARGRAEADAQAKRGRKAG